MSLTQIFFKNKAKNVIIYQDLRLDFDALYLLGGLGGC